MKKDFTKWHAQKSQLQDKKIRLNFHERDVWFCSIGANIGFEWDGKGDEFLRPIVVVRKFNNETLWGIPLTSKIKKNRFYFTFSHEDRNNSANLSQLRLVDSKRLKYPIGSISIKDFVELKKRIIGLIQ